MKEEVFSELSLENVNAQILKLVLDWAHYHQNDLDFVVEEEEEDGEEEKGPSWISPTDDISEWDLQFFEAMDLGTTIQLTNAVQVLGIKRLFKTATKTIANMIKGKTPDQLRMFFNL